MKNLNRRKFIKSTALGSLAFTGSVKAMNNLEHFLQKDDKKPKKLKPEKPNLLFLWTDEQSYNTMAAYGNDKIKTPNLNKLASESFVFKTAYVSQAVCTPSRSTVMTGLYPHTNGCTANNIPLKKETKCVPELVNDPEYKTAYMGKWHLGDEIFAQHGFEQWESIEDNYTKYYSEGKDRSARSTYHHWLVEKGYGPPRYDENKFDRFFCTRLPEEHSKPAFLSEKACEFMEQNRDNPFMLYVNFLEPHSPIFSALDELHKREHVDLPENTDDPLEKNEPMRYRLLHEGYKKGYDFEDEAKHRDLVARYWGLVSLVDKHVGKILDKLEALGLDDNTIVVYTSDHGNMLGAHHLMYKTVMYEESSHVPFLMRVPQIGREQKIIEENVSQIDIVPTVLELMNIKRDEHLQGNSLVPVMLGEKPDEDHVFIEWNPPLDYYIERKKKKGSELASTEEVVKLFNEHTRAVVSPDGWKLCVSDVDKNQLFNLNEDTLETTNLFYSGKHDDKIKALFAKIQVWQRNTGDRVKLNI